MAVITLARQVGSGGQTIAQSLAERLGYRVVSRRDLQAEAAARGSRLPAAFAEFADEQRLANVGTGRLAPLYFSVGEMEFGDALRGGGARGRGEHGSVLSLLAHERQTLLLTIASLVYALAAEDNLILVGAGSQFLLAGLPGVARIKIVAPPDARARRMVEAHGLDAAGARQAVRNGDREQIEYNRAVFDADWDDPLHWDLIVNTDTITPERARDIILGAALAGSMPEPLASPLTERLRQASAICRGLAEPGFAGSGLFAAVLPDTLVLHGEAANHDQAARAVALARRCCPDGGLETRVTVRGQRFGAAYMNPATGHGEESSTL